MKLLDCILPPDTRANQPAATTVPDGALYFVTDEGVVERSNHATWEAFSGAGGGGGGSGAVVQVVRTQTGAYASGNSVIPLDDTVPQNTEGIEFMTCAITPTDAANQLQIDVVCFLAGNAPNWFIAALFQDSGAGALAAMANYIGVATAGGPVVLRHVMTAGTTSATTFKVRGGRDASAGSSVQFNGQSGGRIFGGVIASSLTITEVIP